MLRRILKVLTVIVVVLILLVVGVWFLLQPPVLAVPSQKRLVFFNVTVINPGRDRRVGRTLTIQDGQIVAITPNPYTISESEAGTRFAGFYVLPGLIDMHVHQPPFEAELYGLLFLAHGVTSVRNTGDFSGTILKKRQQIRNGAYPGPRIFACGPIIDGDPPFWPDSRVVRTVAEVQAAVDEVAAAGADCVKVYGRLSGELLAAIREAAARHKLPVVGHVPLAVPFEEAHIRDVQHLTGVPLYTNHADTSRMAQFAAWAAAWQNLDEARINFIVRTSVEQGLSHTPTLVVWARMGRLRDYPTLRDDPTTQLLPRWYREVFWRPREATLPADDDIGAALPKMKAVVRRLYKAGVRIHTGSDTPNPFVVPGASLHEELHYLADAGLTPAEAWVAATRWPGETLGMAKLGIVQEGAPADFLLFREDPTRDLAALSTLEAVVAQGRLYPKAVLDAALARHRAYFNGWLYDRLSMLYARWLASRTAIDQQ
jgi:cytosine/adenosine deaminase-related metal-dependent hydrolase